MLILSADPYDPYKLTGKTRTLGLTVLRGTSVMVRTRVFVLIAPRWSLSMMLILVLLHAADLSCGRHNRDRQPLPCRRRASGVTVVCVFVLVVPLRPR
jgi:hypothetical protein